MKWKIILSRFSRLRISATCMVAALFTVNCLKVDIGSAVNSRFKESIRGDMDHVDLRTVVPANWERICIAYLPYAAGSDVEKKYQGKIVGQYNLSGDANWMILGISAQREISQIVLDVDVSRFLASNLSSVSDNCAYRTEAVLKSTTNNGKKTFHFGSGAGRQS